MTAHPLSAVRYENTPPVGVVWSEYANAFPWLDGAARDELKADISRNGVLVPIVFLGEYILDGRNRYEIARELGLEYPRVEYEGDDPAGFAWAMNGPRRHMSTNQKATAAARLANIKPRAFSGNQHVPAANLQTPQISQAKAAEMVGVSERTVASAAKVLKDGAPELVAAVDKDEISVSAAADLTALPVEDQIKALADKDPQALSRVIRDARAVKQAAKKERRVEREQQTAEKIRALPDKRYGVILADPEWKFEVYSAVTGMDRSAENHYATSELDDIKARDVASIAADDCVLFLWATAPMLPQALEVMRAWGFAYKTHAIWFKRRAGDGRGTGYWFLGEHELLLVGTRGDVVAPAMGTQFRSIFEAPVGAHSEKPELSLEIIETYFPTIPKIELNRRGPARPGWDAWGAEAEQVAA